MVTQQGDSPHTRKKDHHGSWASGFERRTQVPAKPTDDWAKAQAKPLSGCSGRVVAIP